MNFLSPWFLLGTLAVAGPVLFHLIRRSARERMAFSSVLFLRQTPPGSTRRRRLEHIALLLLRCLAILLLAVAFARPFFPKSDASPPPQSAGQQTVILLDTSASMRRTGLWAKAHAVALQYIDKASLNDRVAIMTFDRQPRALVSFTEWLSWPVDQRVALAKQRLEAMSPGWGGTQLGPALTGAAEQFQEDASNGGASASRVVALISDMQEGANLDGLQGHEWPKGVRVTMERVDPTHRGNAGLEVLNASSASTGDEGQVRVRIANARDSDRETFTLAWDSTNAKPAQIYLPPGQTRTFAAPPLPTGAASDTLVLTGDEEDFDNKTYFVAPEMERVLVAYFGSESANDPQQLRYYLQRAFPDSGRRQVEVVSTVSNSVFAPETLNRAALVVIPASLNTEEAAAVRQWITGGKTALLVMTNTQSGATLAALTGVPDLEVGEASGDYALLGEVDFTHPLFAPFSDPKYSDFSRIHFWKHRRWTIPPNLPARVLAKFDDGAPALAQITIGQGSLLVLAAGWNPADSQLALSTKFLPLMQTILDWSGGSAPVRAQFQIGEPIPCPVASGETLHWMKPNGKEVDVATGTAFTETDLPGIYTVTVGAKLRRFAVNLPLDESRTAPMSPDDLARLGVPLQSTPEFATAKTPVAQHVLQRAEMENRQKIWRWMIAGLLAVALVEIVLGGWLAQRVKTMEVTL